MATQILELTLDNFLPRGATMQGTGANGVLALVLYTGSESKLVLNQGKYKYKTSKTEINLNLIFLGQLVQIFAFCTIFACLHYDFMVSNRGNTDYIFEGVESEGSYSAGIFFSFWFIMMRYIPFDVIMQTETGKIAYSKFIEWDANMIHYDPEVKEIVTCQVQSMQLPESLGEVDHIFCDKTGTLTQNDLDVKALCFRKGIVCKGQTRQELNESVIQSCPRRDALDLYLAFCLCNEMRVVRKRVGTTESISYDGSSQDEHLMLMLSQESDLYELVNRDQFTLTVRDKSENANIVFEIIRMIPFSTERKRQTVIVRQKKEKSFLGEEDEYLVLTKGADEAIISRAVRGESDEDEIAAQRDIDSTRQAVDSFAEDGLRTLVYGSRRLKIQQTQVSKFADEDFERDLELIGVTGLEDKMQEDVQSCISEF